MQLSNVSRIGIIVAFVAVIVCGGIAGFAFANDRATYDTIPQNTFCEGVDLGGMDAQGAVDALGRYAQESGKSVVLHLVDESSGETFDIPLSDALVYDIDDAVAEAIERNHDTPVLGRLTGAKPDRVDIDLSFKVDEGKLYDAIAGMKGAVHRDSQDAWRDFNDNDTVTVHEEVIGRELDVDKTFANATTTISSLLADAHTFSEAAAADLTIPMVADFTTPYLTVDEMPPAIIIDYSEFKLRVFKLDECIWWCWIGYGRGYDPNYDDTFDSPTGLHYITYKDPAPVWTNPDPDGWGAGRPDVIEAGPDNPLGLRALKISDAPMIYIHGVNYTYLLGQRLSHGCINVYNDQIVELYDLLPDPSECKDQLWVYFHDYPETNDYGYKSSGIDESTLY